MALNCLSYHRLPRLFSVATLAAALHCLSLAAQAPVQTDAEDPFQWLEEVAERALGWVRQQNVVSSNALETSPVFEPMRRRLLEIMDSKERIPFVTKYGRYYYNFWRESCHDCWYQSTSARFQLLSIILINP